MSDGMKEQDRLDIVVIAGDQPQEVLGRDIREKVRLTVDGIPATLAFLRSYFHAGRDAAVALDQARRDDPGFLSLNGPYLDQTLTDRGFSCALIGQLAGERERLKELASRRPRVVAISTTFIPFARQIDAMAEWVKANVPGALVVAGGIQVWKSYRHKQMLDAGEIGADISAAVAEHNYLMDPLRPTPLDGLIVSDAGEETLVSLLSALRDGRDTRGLGNTAWFENGRWRMNQIETETAREIRMDWGRFLPGPTRAWVPVQAGVGCAAKCAFCDFQGLRRVSIRSPESVVDEVATIPAFDGVRRVYFTDDNLFSSAKRAREICKALIARNLGVRWRGMLRIGIVNDEVAELMAESGCLEVLLGIESGDPGILAAMNKGGDPDRIVAGIEKLAKHGINTKSMFITGFPGETDASIANTVNLLNAYPTGFAAAHRYLFFTYAVLPLSRMAAAAARREHGLVGYGYHWKHSSMSAEEASLRMAALHDAIKSELSPGYVLEVPELDGLGIEGIKTVYRLRNLISRRQRGLERDVDETQCWDEMEEVFRCRVSGVRKT
jgi:p-methyltransferase